ncbi:MAG TPA: PaaI family thioesterase [Rhizomicrobium sp.]|nr:PaaI family thioesterase [Rhizomicrobium sp.]
MSSDIPAGFAPFKLAMGFLAANGPLYGKWDGTHLLMGFRVEPRHCNPGQVAHGGMMATFADMLLPIASRFQAKTDMGFLPTVSLTCDFLAPAGLGAWVEGRAEVLRMTRNMLFAQGVATADGEPCLRANGIFKIQAPRQGAAATDFSVKSLFDFKD